MKLFVPSAGLALALANEDGAFDAAVLEALKLRNTETNIFSLLGYVIPDLEDSIPAGGLEDYGCSGVGNMDPYAKNLGRPIDEIDTALNHRKQCIHCARSEMGYSYSTYQFDENTNNCGKFIINLIIFFNNNYF